MPQSKAANGASAPVSNSTVRASKGDASEGDADDVSLPQPGDAIADKYRIDGVLGKGGMGVVFSAAHMVTGKRLALKWMLPSVAGQGEATQRFVREAQAAGRINHPNVVNVYDVGTHRDSVYLVMELLEGEPLSQVLRGGPLAMREAIAVLMPALRGVAAAHERGVIHRDLKPDNIFLSRLPDGRQAEPKVLDFGISKILYGDHHIPESLTQSGGALGSPYYMAPEQALGEREADHRVDVYALGVILYEMLTGFRPFEASSYNELIVKIATGHSEPLRARRPDLPARLDTVVGKAMAREPNDRYPDIASFARALEPFAEGLAFRPRSLDDSPARALPSAVGAVSSADLNPPGARMGLRTVVLITGMLVAIIALVRAGMWIAEGGTGRGPRETSAASVSSRKGAASLVRTSKSQGARRPEAVRQDASQAGVPRPASGQPPQTADQGHASMASYTIRVIPAKAEVFVDGELVGSGETSLRRLPGTQVDLRVAAPGYSPWRRRKIRVNDIPSTITLRPVRARAPESESRVEPECAGDLCESPYGRP